MSLALLPVVRPVRGGLVTLVTRLERLIARDSFIQDGQHVQIFKQPIARQSFCSCLKNAARVPRCPRSRADPSAHAQVHGSAGCWTVHVKRTSLISVGPLLQTNSRTEDVWHCLYDCFLLSLPVEKAGFSRVR